MKLQQGISKQAKQQWVGRELVILAEGESEETPLLWEGRTQFHAPEIDGNVFLPDGLELRPGDLIPARIVAADEYDLIGEPREQPGLLNHSAEMLPKIPRAERPRFARRGARRQSRRGSQS